MRTALLALLVAAPLAAQERQDTVRAEMILPVPVTIVTRGDTTAVDVSVDVEVGTDSLAVLAERIWLAQQAQTALNGQLARCDCDGGIPNWFWAGTLILGAYGIYTWSRQEESSWVINNSNEQTQEQEVTITRKRRGWWKKRPHNPWHPGEQEDDEL